ncbi:MAG: nitrous oxide reductase accessory protein NosL [Candidatus Contendobacter sp.]
MATPVRRWLATVVLTLALGPAWSQPLQLPAPGPKDTCPVCGMFVSLYPDWVATVWYQDGHAHHFDGAKDLFKYLLELPKYAPGHTQADIAAIGVTDYYHVTRIDARSAWYVIGSDVLGPMGHELIPLTTPAEAEEFLKDHHGKRIVRFTDVTPALLLALDQGQPQ